MCSFVRRNLYKYCKLCCKYVILFLIVEEMEVDFFGYLYLYGVV